jgi:hypothetical protein
MYVYINIHIFVYIFTSSDDDDDVYFDKLQTRVLKNLSSTCKTFTSSRVTALPVLQPSSSAALSLSALRALSRSRSARSLYVHSYDDVYSYKLQTRGVKNLHQMFPYRPVKKAKVQKNVNNYRK